MKNKKIVSKYIPPEKRMKRYEDFEYDTLKDDIYKVKWTDFQIVVKTEKDKKELQAAFEYLHNKDIDTDFVTVNQLVHEYINSPYSRIIVDHDLYNQLTQRTCPHPETYHYFLDGIKYCKLCWKALEVVSYRN